MSESVLIYVTSALEERAKEPRQQLQYNSLDE